MKRNKGFTLIELLAVIVILAILALIAIPIVINIINDSRENSHKRSIEGYGRNVENAITSYIEKNDVNEIPTTLSSYQVKMSGAKVKCDDEFEYNDDELILTNCRVVDNKGKQKSKHTYTYKNRKLINEDDSSDEDNDSSNNNKEYTIGEEVIVKKEKYNVIGLGENYVTLLKQEPLTVNEVNTYGGVGTSNNHVNRYSFYSQGTARDENGYGGMSYYSSLTCGFGNVGDSWSGNFSGCENEQATNYDTSDIKYVVDNWADNKFSSNDLKEVNNYKARLAKQEELRKIGWSSCDYTNWCPSESTTPSWIYNSNYIYWTMSQYSTSSLGVWLVCRGSLCGNDGFYYSFKVYDGSGTVRPVINIYKSAIK